MSTFSYLKKRGGGEKETKSLKGKKNLSNRQSQRRKPMLYSYTGFGLRDAKVQFHTSKTLWKRSRSSITHRVRTHTYFILPGEHFIRLCDCALRFIGLYVSSEERACELEHQRRKCPREGPQRKSGTLASEKEKSDYQGEQYGCCQ